ncbi:MAG TPA: ABC transporter permease subunit [Gammaproteobacteria bacterium]|nr:ABC transporter permease subunit [Gammaproteobacteria bacterium]
MYGSTRVPQAFYHIKRVGIQLLVLVAIAWVGYLVYTQALLNIHRLNLNYGFEFLQQQSGFDISFKLMDYSSESSCLDALIVGLLNTLLVSLLGIVLSTIIGLSVGVGSLSNTTLIKQSSKTYINIARNIPLLAQLLFWYNLLINALPQLNKSMHILGFVYLNNRGLSLPRIEAPWLKILSLLLIIQAIRLIVNKHKKNRNAWLLTCIGGAVLLATLSVDTSWTFNIQFPTPSKFSIKNATFIPIELICLLIGLSTYIGAFIAEIVRAGLLSIHQSQYESAYALGLKQHQIIQKIIIPQALPLMIPPTLNQYLNLLKASSLAVAIGFPDLVSVFTGTVLNQTGQALEIILITMGVYLFFNLLISFIINQYNKTQLTWKSNDHESNT